MGLILLAVLLMHGSSGGEGLRASGLSDFLRSSASHLSWPWKDAWPPAALIYAPAGVLFASILLDRGGVRRSDAEFALMLAGTAAIQILAMAYARDADGAGPHPRYADIHLLGALANAFCLITLSRTPLLQRSPAAFSGFLDIIKAPLSRAWTLASDRRALRHGGVSQWTGTGRLGHSEVTEKSLSRKNLTQSRGSGRDARAPSAATCLRASSSQEDQALLVTAKSKSSQHPLDLPGFSGIEAMPPAIPHGRV